MKRSLSLGLLVLLASCDSAAPSPWAAPPELALDLRVEVAPLEVGVLQPVSVTVDRYRAGDVQATLQADFDDADWVEQERVERDEQPLGQGFWQRTVFTLLPLRGPGELRVPALRVEASDGAEEGVAASSEEVVVLVTSVLSDEHGAEIEAPGAPFSLPPSPLSILPRHSTNPYSAIDVHAPCQGKAEAIRFLEETKGIPASRVIAIGDADNDVPMLRRAGLGVAMGNAFPEVQAEADRVLDHHHTDAIGALVEDLLLR